MYVKYWNLSFCTYRKKEYISKNKINFMKRKKKFKFFLDKGLNTIKICFNDIFVD